MIQEKLKNLRKQMGFTQERIAEMLSTDVSNYCRKENGKIKIHNDEWVKLSVALECEISDIKEHSSDNHNGSPAFLPMLYELQSRVNQISEQNNQLKKVFNSLLEVISNNFS